MPRHATVTIARTLLAALAAGAVCSCAPTATGPRTAARASIGPLPADDAPRDLPGLHNVVAYHDGFYSGSAPDGEAGFDTLRALGVRTVISVDGAVPDVDAAAARGMRSIHLPIGYDGFDETRRLELARAAHDAIARGPVYVHCHHGKHRSAGAAGAVAVTLGWAAPEEMVARMRVSGTSPSYPGLYECTERATPVGLAALAEVPADFPSVSRPTGLVHGMVEIDHAHEHLRSIATAGWDAPDDHPDLVPAAEAARLFDLLRLLPEQEDVRGRPNGFDEQLRAATAAAQRLEELVVANAAHETLTAQLDRVTASCKACHARFRD